MMNPLEATSLVILTPKMILGMIDHKLAVLDQTPGLHTSFPTPAAAILRVTFGAAAVASHNRTMVMHGEEAVAQVHQWMTIASIDSETMRERPHSLIMAWIHNRFDPTCL
jgi:hypothetical protein